MKDELKQQLVPETKVYFPKVTWGKYTKIVTIIKVNTIFKEQQVNKSTQRKSLYNTRVYQQVNKYMRTLYTLRL